MESGQRIAFTRQEIALRAADGALLRGSRTLGPGRPKAAVVIAHGYAEHTGRYGTLIEALAASRFVVYAVDHRGHGRSDGDRAHIDRFDQFIDDLKPVVDLARSDQAGNPCYLLGHSMGGLIALRFSLAYQELLDGLVLMSPAIKPVQDASRAQEVVLRGIARVAPKLPVVKGLTGVLSTDPEVEARTKQDPLFYNGRTRAKLAVELVDAGRDALKRGSSLKLPVLILQGDDDGLVDPAGAKALYKAIGVRPNVDNSLITWPGMKHELLNEPDGEQVVGVVVAWLNGHYTEWRKAQARS